MSVNVHDVMQLKIMAKAQVVAGHKGCDHIVEYVDVLESSEGYQWLRKNTLLITTLHPIRDDEQAQRLFMQHLHSVSVAAVAIKPKRFVEKIPEFMLADADRYNIPIIELPLDSVYSDLVSKLSQLIINSHAVVMQETLNISKMFTDVVQNGGGIDEIAHTLSQNVRQPVIIEDKDFNILSYACENTALKKDIARILQDNRQVKSILKKQPPLFGEQMILRLNNQRRDYMFHMAAIIFNNQCVGYISVVDQGQEADEIRDIALENAATVAALIIATIQSNQEKEAMIKYGVLTDLIFGNTYTQESISAWMDYFGWTNDSCYIASVLQIIFNLPGGATAAQQKNLESNLFQVLSHLMKEIMPTSYIVPQKQTMIMIHEIKNGLAQYRAEMIQQLEQLRLALREYDLPLHYNICIGLPVSGFMRISTSYQQALIALNISERITENNHNYGFYFYEDLDVYHIFTQYHDKRELAEFSNKYLQPLLSDERLKFDALGTLEAYILHGCSINKSAAELYVHVNTMKYRVGKLKEILRNPMQDFAYLYKLYMAICIHKIL